MEIDDKTKEYAENTITYFRKNYIPEGVEINYQLLDENTIKFKIPKDHYNFMLKIFYENNVNYEIESFPELLNF